MDSTDWKLSFFPGMIPDSPVLWPVLQHKGAQIQQTKGSAKPQAQFVLPTNQPNQSAVQPRTTPQMVSGLRIRNQVAVNGQKTITVQFNHPSGDPYFAGANVYLRRAGQEPTLVAGGSSSPLSFTVPINDAPHTVHVTSFGNWGETDVLKSPSAPVKLAGIQAGKVPTVPADISVTATSPSSPSPSTPFFFDGVWNSATAYSLNYIVLFNSSTYICLLANTNQQPDESPTYWTLLSENLVFYPTIATTVVSTGVQALDVSNQVQGNSTTVTATATPSQANDIGFWFAYLNVGSHTMSTPSGWINIFASGPNILGFMDQFSSSSPLSLSNGISSQPWASNLLLFKTAAGYSITASVTQVAVSAGNVATVLCANSFSAGTQVGFSNLVQATFLNGNQYTILTATSTQFTFSISGHASYGPTADTGTATNLPYLQIGTQSSGGLSSTSTTALSSPVTAGSTLIALIAGTGGAAPSLTSASDTLGNTWHILSSNSGSAQMNVAYAQNVIGGATDTITLNSSNGYVAAIIASWEISSSITTIYHYVPYDVVQFRGGWFVCLEETTQDAFTNPSAWGILSFSIGTVDALVSTPVTLNILNRGQLISNSTATADTVNLPATPPDTAWYVFFQNSGAGSIIISPNGLKLDGSASSLTLVQNQGVVVFTDGTNYFTERGFGTVFSVGLSMPAIFSVANSPITSSGILTVTLAAETANFGFFGPTSGSAAAPTFRAMVVADLPTSGTWPFAGTISGNFEISGELLDSTGAAGTSGQVLSSTSTAVKWVTAGGAGSGGVNSQTGNYLALSGDAGKLISMNGSNLTLTMPAAPPSSTWWIAVENVNSTTLTISPNSLNIDGESSNLSLLQNQGVLIFTDGTNYFTERGLSSGSGELAAVDLTGQTSSIVTTNFANTGSGLTTGMYAVSGFVDVTAAGSAGSVTVTIAYTTDSGSDSQTSASISLGTLGSNGGFYIPFYATANSNISYATTVSGVTGSPVYTLHLRLVSISSVQSGSAGANTVFAGPTSGAAGVASFRSLIIGDYNVRNVDTPPLTAGSEDDEFLGTTLNAAWTVVTNSASAINIDTNVPSALWVKTGTGSTNAYIITKSITSGGGDFNFTCKLGAAASQNFHYTAMSVMVDSNDYWELAYTYNSLPEICTFTVVGGSATQRSTLTLTASPLYFHIERKSTTIAAYYSTDGVSWYEVFSSTTILQASTFATLRLQFLNNGATTSTFMYCDWVRRNYITLLP